MSCPIADYALIGNSRTAALVSRDGSIDWMCVPRFDSPACFAALLGRPEHGRWLLAPAEKPGRVERRYRGDSVVLETDYETSEGLVRVVDCMPHQGERCDVTRVVRGLRGRVEMRMELIVRFDYGSIVPWVHRDEDIWVATAGPDSLRLLSDERVEPRGEDLRTVAEFAVDADQRLPFVLTHYASHEPAPLPIDAEAAIRATERWWTGWSARCSYEGEWRSAVVRSLLTLKALTHAPTGGIVAAPTASLPEQPGGTRNWDYRYCWIRDATFTLYALLIGGYVEEARSWREWLLRAAAGAPADLQVLYGVAGERRLDERLLETLPGYEGSKPVRVGNAAAAQFQLDVYGELIDALHATRGAGLKTEPEAWALETAILDFTASRWQEPDDGIWEIRGPRQPFTYSKVMAWVAMDRAVKAVERFGLEGPADDWRLERDRIHAQVCERGFNRERGAFVQAYGSQKLDASLLMIPLVGFLPATDPRMVSTVEAIRRELLVDGLVQRYSTEESVDGLPPGEGLFLPCSFWLVDNLALQGRTDEARGLFERLLSLRNDVGLLSEEYDPQGDRLLGNFPQALSHVMLVNSALNLSRGDRRPEHHRVGGEAATPKAAVSRAIDGVAGERPRS
ncbi:MAG: glycoside hydrolase family 15 protein [Acidobacteria bacterium]|jgi:GH15 family glucan-1,4-alpha-glucosidase|nr:glycoside hydrolase family 15 protein [Acidobacteriota bacterium]